MLTWQVPPTTTQGGTLAATGGVVTYTPPANWSGTDTFTYTATDPAANVSSRRR